MYKEEKIIIKYSIPDLGEYSIDENLSLFRDRQEIVICNNLIDARKNLTEIVRSDREKKIEEYRRVISSLEKQSTNLEVFRRKINFM